MDIIVYAMQKISAGGTPCSTYYSLEKPEFCSGFSTYINASEYQLPNGYSVAFTNGKRQILNRALQRCQLAGDGTGHPVLVDPSLPGPKALVALKKVHDITLSVVMEAILEGE